MKGPSLIVCPSALVKWISTNVMLGGKTVMDYQPIQGRVEILPSQ